MAGVCVCCWGRQSSAILSHLSKLTLTRSLKNKNAEPGEQTATNNTKKHQTNTRKGQANKKGGSQQHQTGQKAARRAEPTKEEKGRGGKKASGGQQKEREHAREGSRGRREKTAQAKKAGACSFSFFFPPVWPITL